MDEPATRASEAVNAYRNHLLGSAGGATRSVAHRIDANDATQDSFLGVRGPFIQALPPANWSDQSWSQFAKSTGLDPLIRLAFDQLGFSRLYDFQERTVEAVRNGDDTVVTAATGRGKTEAWLIPILDQIVRANRGRHDRMDPDDVKAVLMYPTKALAQDQLKRLIGYLYNINTELPTSERITIGIYDGDTPTNQGHRAEGYLNDSFEQFSCPGYDETQAKCQACNRGVHVEAPTEGYRLRPEKAACIDEVPLEFVKLTKQEILTDGVDILLTNPDTINLKLINTNASNEHERFVYEPEFLVYDEVHTYDGLFGSYTATLTKRLRTLRQRKNCPSFQVVAASATVDNDVQLFRKLSASADVTHISERPREIDPPAGSDNPTGLASHMISEADIYSTVRNGSRLPGLPEFTPTVSGDYDQDRFEVIVAEKLFEHLSAETPSDSAACLQAIHSDLREDPLRPGVLRERVAERFDLNKEASQTLVANFRVLGEMSGLLERRSHLFTWPLDGFYACAGCDSVYRQPYDECPACETGFVTRARYCRRCDEEHLVAWTCPKCRRLTPYIPNEDGTPHGRDEASCSHCADGSEGDTLNDRHGPRLNRVTFQPEYVCDVCGEMQPRALQCDCDCGTPLVRTGPNTLSCPNPTCGRTEVPGFSCHQCGNEELRLETVDDQRLRPWVCGADDCDRRHFTPEPPSVCECGWTDSFAQTGLIEAFDTSVCQNCGDRVINGDCDCDPGAADHTIKSGTEGRLVVIDHAGARREPSEFATAYGCHHTGLTYDVEDRYDELVRSPNNLAVTTSQYLLRRVAEEEGESAAKLLAFADSHRDMKELDRDFTEPEAETLLDQAIVSAVGKLTTGDQAKPDGGIVSLDRRNTGTNAWVQFGATLEQATEVIDELNESLDPPRRFQRASFDIKPKLLNRVHRRFGDPMAAIRERLTRRAIPHAYRPQLRERGGSLAENGLLDVRLKRSKFKGLSSPQRTVLRTVVDEGNGCHIDKIEPLGGDAQIRDVLDTLEANGLVTIESEEFISIESGVLEVSVAGVDDGFHYAPSRDDFATTLEQQFGLVADESVPLSTSMTQRADPSEPLFTQRAYRIVASSPYLLVSRVYHGLTDKRERRELEYMFRDGSYPHFLSSGPTMELGVDIGDLDALLLYGTPPNVNAYLQRVGRAGRDSGSSLVHSVSQRNPIDFYYYDNPTELIESEPRPVPLNEHNESVLDVSLTWAVFDFVAAEFTIPWEVQYPGRYGELQGGDQFRRRRTGVDDGEYAKLTQVLTLRAKELALGSRDRGLAALGVIVEDHREEILSHLGDVLGYRYCQLCSRKYDHESDVQTCHSEGCEGNIVDASVEFADLRERVVDQFVGLFIDEFERYQSSIDDELFATQSELRQLRQDLRSAGSDKATEIRRRRDSLKERKSALDERKTRIQRMDYGDFLRESRAGEYAFNMRNVEGSVSVTLVNTNSDGYTRTTLGDEYGGRSERMAPTELHPAAAYLEDGATHVVTAVRRDEYQSSELRERTRDTDNDHLATDLVCPACGQSHESGRDACDCGTDRGLRQRRLVALEAVEAHRSDLETYSGAKEARAVYAEPNEEIQNTFAERHTEVLDFAPRQTFDLVTQDGVIGQFAFGDYKILAYTDGYKARYKSGESDAENTPFEVCGVDSCGGVVYRNEDGRGRCVANADHSPDGEEGSEFIRLGYGFNTEGIRINLDDPAANHAFGHGLRLALQALGGVGIREVTEVVNDHRTDVFDSTPGGADVCRQLVAEQNGQFRNFQTAVNLIADQFDCSCEEGCPRCLFQDGCALYNRLETLDRDAITELTESVQLVRTGSDS